MISAWSAASRSLGSISDENDPPPSQLVEPDALTLADPHTWQAGLPKGKVTPSAPVPGIATFVAMEVPQANEASMRST